MGDGKVRRNFGFEYIHVARERAAMTGRIARKRGVRQHGMVVFPAGAAYKSVITLTRILWHVTGSNNVGGKLLKNYDFDLTQARSFFFFFAFQRMKSIHLGISDP